MRLVQVLSEGRTNERGLKKEDGTSEGKGNNRRKVGEGKGRGRKHGEREV